MNNFRISLITATALLSCDALFSQDIGTVSGNFQIDAQYYQPDTAISAIVPDEKAALSGFGNILYRKGKFTAGIRFETYLPAPVGYPAGASWEGTGIGYRFAQYSGDEIDVTVGNFYEQFGSGMILRTWEDHGLGVDYSLDGIRVKSRPYKGIELTGLYGKQRFNFNNGFQNGDGIVRGLNADIDISTLLDSVVSLPGNISIGGSFVSKYQANNSVTYAYPENVDAGSARVKYILGGFRVSGEYAWTGENPSVTNSRILNIPDPLHPGVGLFIPGQGVNLNATYSVRGFGLSVTASSLANMAFQSQRGAGPFDSWINYLPATSVLQTYLLAQLYPYATQPNGQVAYHADLFYNIPKKSVLGGKYGTKIELGYSSITSPEITPINDLNTSRNGANISLFKSGGNLYYSDFNAKATHKFSKTFKGSLFYMNTVYNNTISEGAYDYDNVPVDGTVYSNLLVFEGNVRFNSKNNLRFEVQGLFTHQHLQDWVAVVTEYTISPNWFFSILDQYNYGNAKGDTYHFPNASMGYIKGSSRFSIGYGRQRAGVFCVGGVCRVVPASNGLTVSVTTSF